MDIQTRLAILVAVFGVLAACGRTAPPERERYWSCDGVEFAALDHDDGLALHLPGRTAIVGAADGEPGWYAGQRVSVHFGDESALLEVDGARHACAPKRWAGPWAGARARGASFRAIGQEPGWHVEVIPGREMILVLDYGERTLSMPAPDPIELDGGARGYQIEESRGRLVLVVIEPLVCFDVMSGEVFPETVTVAVENERYRGCGLPLTDLT